MNNQKKNKNRKGFTLIELIVVIAILAILAAVAIPNFVGISQRAEIATQVAAAAEYANAINVYNALNATDIDATALTSYTTLADLNTDLGDLAPKVDTDIDPAKVLGRIAIDANGLASVTNKNAIS
ncbi:MAG: prepilin-type N-terminal cleavage/methylation domain-containing protein [Eubacteriales bacterium]|nr:prepilin-type N-terminal cleavage/methylation domain-containing protein [Eubacteriales bacterium]